MAAEVDEPDLEQHLADPGVGPSDGIGAPQVRWVTVRIAGRCDATRKSVDVLVASVGTHWK